MLCALIMAGGKGERFWPLSTEEKPKQFLNLLGENTMIQMTVKRIEKLIPIEQIFIVTAEKYVHLVREQLPDVPKRNIIVEPVGKNTAPCIGLSAFIINKYYENATLAVVPSDHLIVDEDKFRDTLKSAYNFVNINDEVIVTLGMKPDRPETGYGYIKYEEPEYKIDAFKFKKVERFVEKPDIETARKYVDEANYLWNSGMFIWKTTTILKLIHRYLHKTYEVLNEIAVANDNNFYEILSEKYPKLDSNSIDYSIMEKADNIYVVPSDFGWDDLGSWYSVERNNPKDEYNNTFIGNVKGFYSTNNIIIGNNKPIIVSGINELFIVETDEVILVTGRNILSDVKELKNKI